MTEYLASNYLTFTISILVFFLGVNLNKRFALLREYSIPEPVTGGLMAALVTLLLYEFADFEITYELYIRDILLIYFFTGIGLNARLSDLAAGGRLLAIMLGLTAGYIILQNVVGILGARAVGAPDAIGVLAGSASLIGGHGTAIAWAPQFQAIGINNALEIGVASATIGLIIATLIGGPIAHFLIARHRLKSTPDHEEPVVGIAFDEEPTETIDHIDLMSVFLTLHITIIIGWIIHQTLTEADINLPLFVCCLLTGIILSNTIPRLFPRLHWPVRSRALAIISDFSLGLFLTMSLMSMQLWTIADMAGSLLVILFFQTVLAIAFTLLILFPLMGRNYQAAVLSAGFGGVTLGATPTAIANMTAVTKSHGPAPLAFIILPLVSAFFVDIINAFVIRFIMSL